METKIDLNELNRLTNAIIDACTKDAIAVCIITINHGTSVKKCLYL